ncbi:hypothetical protein NPIL_564881 [Nephila pilipes]|uniref:Uncharacterized protein n=1 Tax=Nephila pilipes TaxID=299642 RepID=A0A8X6P3R1_NEPPI|nr:hypothetical protein NPIL_564881 [Nephila pilipes]
MLAYRNIQKKGNPTSSPQAGTKYHCFQIPLPLIRSNRHSISKSGPRPIDCMRPVRLNFLRPPPGKQGRRLTFCLHLPFRLFMNYLARCRKSSLSRNACGVVRGSGGHCGQLLNEFPPLSLGLAKQIVDPDRLLLVFATQFSLVLES